MAPANTDAVSLLDRLEIDYELGAYEPGRARPVRCVGAAPRGRYATLLGSSRVDSALGPGWSRDIEWHGSSYCCFVMTQPKCTTPRNSSLWSTLLSSLLLLGAACGGESEQNDSPEPAPAEGTLVFRSGYEEGSTVVQGADDPAIGKNFADIVGSDGEFDWEANLDADPRIGSFRIYYENADYDKALAEIVPEPGNEDNRTLRFDLRAPHITYQGHNGKTMSKGRVQGLFKDNPTDLREVYMRQRLRLHPDLEVLTSTGQPINWFTIQEYWNDMSKKELPFRVTLNIRKEAAVGAPLRFGSHGQTLEEGGWVSHWESVDTSFDIVPGKWMTLETYFLEGDSETGRFKVVVTDSDGHEHTVIDVTGYTHHPEAICPERCPNGVANFNPMKLYTSADLIEGVNVADKSLQLYWDDFELWLNRKL